MSSNSSNKKIKYNTIYAFEWRILVKHLEFNQLKFGCLLHRDPSLSSRPKPKLFGFMFGTTRRAASIAGNARVALSFAALLSRSLANHVLQHLDSRTG